MRFGFKICNVFSCRLTLYRRIYKESNNLLSINFQFWIIDIGRCRPPLTILNKQNLAMIDVSDKNWIWISVRSSRCKNWTWNNVRSSVKCIFQFQIKFCFPKSKFSSGPCVWFAFPPCWSLDLVDFDFG